jgi:uncharacterized protein YkuJ
MLSHRVLALVAVLCLGSVAGQDLDKLLKMENGGGGADSNDLAQKLQKSMANAPASANGGGVASKVKDPVDELAENVIQGIQPVNKKKADNKVQLDQVDMIARTIIRGITTDVATPAPAPKPKVDAVDELAQHVIAGIQTIPKAKADNKVQLDVVDMIARSVIRGIQAPSSPAKPAPKPKADAIDELAQNVIKDIQPVQKQKENNKVQLDQVDMLARRVMRGQELRPEDIPGQAAVTDLATQMSKVASAEPAAARSD